MPDKTESDALALEPSVYTTPQVSQRSNVSESWFNHDRLRPEKEREGPPFIRIGKLVRYPRDKFEAWLAGRRS